VNAPVVSALVVLSTAQRPASVLEQWRLEFDWPSHAASVDVPVFALEEPSGRTHSSAVIAHDCATTSMVQLAVRAYCMVRTGNPALPKFLPYGVGWHRVDFRVLAYTGSPYGTDELRLAIDASSPNRITVHWDDGAQLGVRRRRRVAADADPVLLALKEALKGHWNAPHCLRAAAAKPPAPAWG
jgi:hypothetical protein